MSVESELRVMQLCKGKSIKAVEYRLNLLNKYIKQRIENGRERD